MISWNDVQQHTPLYLNLGGKSHCHPHAEYQHYVSVDSFMEGSRPEENDPRWIVEHDLRNPMPLPDATVDRIHTEDCLHYLEEHDVDVLLAECHRLLKPDGFMRMSVPDYMHPMNREYDKDGKDPRYPKHKICTTKDRMDAILERSPFARWAVYHYWSDDAYIAEEIDYTQGMIQRTPDNDPRCHRVGSWRWQVRNALTYLRYGLRIPEQQKPRLRGHPLHITSLVIDAFPS